jgi:peptide/nickel transport system substrate-binding protein
LKWADPDLFVDPANPVGGSNWTYDSQWQLATSDIDTISHPHTGLSLPQRLERAEVTMQEGLPIGQTLDWVTLEFVPEITVPADAWINWDPASETFITVGEQHPEGLTAKRKVVYYYPAGMLDDIYWHDGSKMTVADFIMPMIMAFAVGTEGSVIYDESQAGTLAANLEAFRGYKLVSEDPLSFELYSDLWYLDAEQNAVNFRATFWPEYGYGNAPWHTIAIANMAEADGTLAYTGDKADTLEVEWMNWIGGPSLEIMSGYLDQAAEASLIPFEATLGDYITAEEAADRYANLAEWYKDHGHFWVGTGPYYLDDVFLVEKTCSLKHNPYYIDPSDKWAGFAEPKLADVDIDGPGIVAIGEEAVYDVYVTFAGAAYPMNEIMEVKYLLFDAAGEVVEVGTAEAVVEGQYSVTLSADTTGALEAGANKLEIAVLSKVVSVPAFSTLEFVTE